MPIRLFSIKICTYIKLVKIVANANIGLNAGKKKENEYNMVRVPWMP